MKVDIGGGRCDERGCHYPDTGCVLGVDDCPHLSARGSEPAPVDVVPGRSLPWSGLPLGRDDMVAVAAAGRGRFIAVLGPANAGKTTLLGAHWLALRHGRSASGLTFHGSATLLGWNRISRPMEWAPFGSGFPAHTTAADKRTPSLLHVTYSAEGAGTPLQVFYTDVPGEWFADWAADVDSAPGAQWVVDNADVFVLVVDSEGLAGPDRGAVKSDFVDLARRLADARGSREVLVVRTKADVEASASTLAWLDVQCRRILNTPVLSVSVHAGPARAEVAFDDAVRAASQPWIPAPPDPGPPVDEFAAFAWSHPVAAT